MPMNVPETSWCKMVTAEVGAGGNPQLSVNMA